MLSAEGVGKTIEKAIESALAELKAPREDVDIKILSEGGLFKKARVVVTISDDAKEKYLKREKARVDERVKEDIDKALKEAEKQTKKDVEKALKQADKQTKKDVKKAVDEANKEVKKVLKTVEKETAKTVKEVDKKTEQVVKEVVSKKAKRDEDKVVEPKTFLEGFFKVLGREVEISELEDENFVTYSVTGENLGDIIGKRGEAFYALNTLLSTVAGKRNKKILLDIDNYKEKREESLAGTARRLANKVAKTGRYMKLEPMNPSERRIIHTTLQNDDRVTTLSKGTDPRRYVIIFPKEYKDKE